MKRLLPIAIGVLVLGLFAATLLFLYKKSQAQPVVYKTDHATVMDIIKKTVASGSIVPRREVELKPRVSGVLDKLLVAPGDQVKEGQEIARIKIIPNVVSLNQAEAQVAAAKIAFDSAKKEHDRYQTLFAQKLVSDAEVSRYALDFDLKRQELDAAESNLDLVKSGASRGVGKVSNVVTSTVTGMVIEVPVKEGVSVTETNNFNPGTTIASIADMGDMIFDGRVDESEVGKVKEGMDLDITIGALADHHLKGKLEYISPKGESVEGAIQFEIKASIKPEPGVFIRANYSANADIVLDRRLGVLGLDEGLLQFDKDGSPFVEVEVRPKELERRVVKTGVSDGIHIEILSGMTKDDAVRQPDLGHGEAKPAGAK